MPLTMVVDSSYGYPELKKGITMNDTIKITVTVTDENGIVRTTDVKLSTEFMKSLGFKQVWEYIASPVFSGLRLDYTYDKSVERFCRAYGIPHSFVLNKE